MQRRGGGWKEEAKIEGGGTDPFKGTVARDFLVSFFFMDLLYISPRFRG
jgi:hypothetical protein